MATLAETTGTAGPRYTKVAIWLHWLIGMAVIANIGLAMLTEGLPRETQRAAMDIHKALGITVLALTVVRILWRVGHKPPPPARNDPGVAAMARQDRRIFSSTRC